jgi:hypothetical protein
VRRRAVLLVGVPHLPRAAVLRAPGQRRTMREAPPGDRLLGGGGVREPRRGVSLGRRTPVGGSGVSGRSGLAGGRVRTTAHIPADLILLQPGGGGHLRGDERVRRRPALELARDLLQLQRELSRRRRPLHAIRSPGPDDVRSRRLSCGWNMGQDVRVDEALGAQRGAVPSLVASTHLCLSLE